LTHTYGYISRTPPEKGVQPENEFTLLLCKNRAKIELEGKEQRLTAVLLLNKRAMTTLIPPSHRAEQRQKNACPSLKIGAATNLKIC
jgi:hypothetical protein